MHIMNQREETRLGTGASVLMQWSFDDCGFMLFRWKSFLSYTMAVTIAERSHLFPFRTQKLSSLTPKVLSPPRLSAAQLFRLLSPKADNYTAKTSVSYFKNQAMLLLFLKLVKIIDFSEESCIRLILSAPVVAPAARQGSEVRSR